ncbi:hypothetical protein T492DRAFT_878599 [Pavlovales sp. CCMP2436]|nr:hypothetical protein T492DRAFT_878599 [Pavlovales sp. CCMP2436]
MSVSSLGERELHPAHAQIALHCVSAISVTLGPHLCVTHRRYSHYVALQHELEAAFPRLQLPCVAHELKRGRYTQWNWAPHLPLDAAAVEARLGLLQEYVDALLHVRELALSPQLARFFWPKDREDTVESL